MQRQKQFSKFKNGRGGVYTEQYHELLGTTQWIRIKNLWIPHQPQEGSAATDSGAPPVLYASPQLSEGDVVAAFSQFGEIEDIRFVRNPKNGHFQGTAFVKYVNFRSGITAADTMNSDVGAGELFYLNNPVRGQRGIEVDRCDAAAVPAMYNDSVLTYPSWVRQQMVTL